MCPSFGAQFKVGKFPQVAIDESHEASLNESPHPKVGKFELCQLDTGALSFSLNESPHPKVGKSLSGDFRESKRERLNESPHPKVGK